MRELEQLICDVRAAEFSKVVQVLTQCHQVFTLRKFAAFSRSLRRKELYGNRIWEIYELCGGDLERFAYHVMVELPHQTSGIWPKVDSECEYSDRSSDVQFARWRTRGRPHANWAHHCPPRHTNYHFPYIL